MDMVTKQMLGHAAWTWTCSMDINIQHGHAYAACDMKMQHGRKHPACTGIGSMDMEM
jgi:hypothetical protein